MQINHLFLLQRTPSRKLKDSPQKKVVNLHIVYSIRGSYLEIKEAFSSVKFSGSVVFDSLWPHGLQHTRPPCPSPTPRAYSNSPPLHQWCHPTISSSAVPFSRLQAFPASGSFPVSQFFTSVGQSIGVSASASVLPLNIQGWFGKPNTYGVKSF